MTLLNKSLSIDVHILLKLDYSNETSYVLKL